MLKMHNGGIALTLRHMKVFLAVYQTENVTRAAQMLNLTQPVVTRTIQEIEKYYGVCLFERINRRLHITEAGKTFYTYALHIIDAFDQMEKGMRNWDELGLLRVGATITLGNALLPRVLPDFQKEHPSLRIRSTVSNGAQLQRALLDNQLDFALIEGDIEDPDLNKEAIARDRLVLVLPPEDPRKDGGPIGLRDLSRDSFLLREQGSMGRSLIDQVFSMNQIPVEPVMESVSTQAIIRGVHYGLGISFLPEALVSTAIRAGVVSTQEVRDVSLVRDNYLVWHRCKFLTRSASELMDRLHSVSLDHT